MDQKDLPRKPDKTFGFRHLQCLLMFLCLTIAYSFRVNLSVAIVSMTDNTTTNAPNYEWTESTKGLVISSFFWGYVITQVPAALIVKTYGTVLPLTLALLICSVMTIVTPFCAKLGWGTVAACRAIEGFTQGFCFPSMHTLLAKWVPPSERGRLSTFVYAGAQFGTIISLVTSGYLAESELGWPSIFYINGCFGVIWCALWFFFGGNSPSEYARISDEEKKYIEASLNTGDSHDEKKIPTPWKALFTSLPFWALLIAHSGHNWGFWTLLTEMPNYMSKVLDFDIKKNGLLSALPYFVMYLLSFVFSFMSDFVINRNIMSVGASRKVANSIGHWIAAAALIGLGYVTADHAVLAVVLLTLAVGVLSSNYVGFQLNHIDLSPNHAGTMMGITNCVANVMSIIAPIICGAIVNENAKDPALWRTVFFISAAIYFLGNLFFVLFSSADIQPWNEPKTENYDAEIAEMKTRYETQQEKPVINNEQTNKC